MGDITGQFTSFHYNGSAVVDYCIVKYELFHTILYFTVLDASHLSDHAAIRVYVDGSVKQHDEINQCSRKYVIFPKGYRWEESDEVYKNVFESPHFVQKIRCMDNDDGKNVNHLCNEISKLLI